jgi:hypothetical protein
MASEDDANKVRQQHGRDLMKKGVHAIGVEEGKDHGKDGWVVVAHVEPDAKVELPSTLSYSTKDGGEVKVPLVVARSEPFKPE